MRHVVSMTMAGAVGLVSIFAVDLLNLFYISLLGRQELTAAIGYASSVLYFSISTSIGFTIAATAIVSTALGVGKVEGAKSDAGTTLIFMAIVNTLTAIILYPLLGPFLTLLGAIGRTHQVALDFLQIITFTIPLMGFGMCCSGLLRAKGDGKRAMYVTLSAGVVAAILNPILIIYLELARVAANRVHLMELKQFTRQGADRSAIQRIGQDLQRRRWAVLGPPKARFSGI